jgi:hypothetical protein
MRTRAVLTGAGWLAGATAAVVGVTAAMTLLGHDLLGRSDPTLTSAQVRQELGHAGQPGSGVAAPALVVPASGVSAQGFQGGTVAATCAGGKATLATWTVDQGFHLAGISSGPATAAWIRFTSNSFTQLVSVTCVGNTPRFACKNGDGMTAGSGTAASDPMGSGTTTAGTPPPAAPSPTPTETEGGGGGSGRGGGPGPSGR